ncbi:DegT/DnrJ/EryC1/StrS family aminotransferase [Paeniglutamicibacter gangotriensis]|uniref:Aminotransferase family, DegT/DnrJ/EryC1/StrS n=1 Tax=Paeniglutamicibacter gangotriensis Lz1y TaxID=1276920 RepID=M7NLY0_9MICC|nr:DegT/DnrJ/EryC1/StrS family aminotransferase [Paeniglutamicibacter gangotriensis]EMQ99548.1 aminotransferase family, DegT/DnrJ/EryC1/StrS [Paeniglutamicibacter gangotriensis Lz1y]
MEQQAFLPFALPDITEREIEAVVESMRSGWVTTGPKTAEFEKTMATFLGDSELHCVAVNSATAGLHLAVEALGLGPGDEVLVPTWTFTSTAEVVRYVGATPVFVDVEESTLNIDFDDAESKVNANTKAIMPVHFAGHSISADRIEKFASRHGLKVVEDAAHAFPATNGSSMVGNSSSDAVVFSFYATKTITTGEGGLLVTRNADLAQRARTMRLHGISRDVFARYTSKVPAWRYDVVAPGFKYNMTDIAAAMGVVQLSRAEEMRQNREAIAERYFEAFAGLPIGLPESGQGLRHSWHLFVLRVGDAAPIDRDKFIEDLAGLGVGTSVHFIPLHRHPYWRETYNLSAFDFPIAERAFEQTVSLPIFSSMTEQQVDRVINAVKKVLAPA